MCLEMEESFTKVLLSEPCFTLTDPFLSELDLSFDFSKIVIIEIDLGPI